MRGWLSNLKHWFKKLKRKLLERPKSKDVAFETQEYVHLHSEEDGQELP